MELKQLLQMDVDLKESIVALFQKIARRQTTILVIVAVLSVATGAVLVRQATKPTHIDRSVLQELERERDALKLERAALLRERRAVDSTRTLLVAENRRLQGRDSALLRQFQTLNKQYENLSAIAKYNSAQIQRYFANLPD